MNISGNSVWGTAGKRLLWGCSIACIGMLQWGDASADGTPRFDFEMTADRLNVSLDQVPIGGYVFHDDQIPRPYWTGMRAPGGQRITRVHPPSATDYADHPAMHPGIWLAFGDINGYDFWRNKARIKHVRFVKKPALRDDRLVFSVENGYESPEGVAVCSEVAAFALRATQYGYLIDWTSEFSAVNRDIVFGDQEEMGLGFRVTRPLSVEYGRGEIRNDRGDRNEAEVWGMTAKWCDYSAVMGNQRLGVTIMPHPQNFRDSWMHARDYGFLAANPFGRHAMTGGEASAIRVERGSTLILRFGVYVYASPASEANSHEAVYARYAARER